MLVLDEIKAEIISAKADRLNELADLIAEQKENNKSAYSNFSDEHSDFNNNYIGPSERAYNNVVEVIKRLDKTLNKKFGNIEKVVDSAAENMRKLNDSAS